MVGGGGQIVLDHVGSYLAVLVGFREYPFYYQTFDGSLHLQWWGSLMSDLFSTVKLLAVVYIFDGGDL